LTEKEQYDKMSFTSDLKTRRLFHTISRLLEGNIADNECEEVLG
jgi:hypothetical protein